MKSVLIITLKTLLLSFILLYPFSAYAADIDQELLGADVSEGTAFGDWTYNGSYAGSSRIEFNFSHKKFDDLAVVLVTRDEQKNSYAHTKSFNIFYKSEAGIAESKQLAISEVMDIVLGKIKANDQGKITLIARIEQKKSQEKNARNKVDNLPPGVPDWLTKDIWTPIDISERALAFVLLCVFFIAFIYSLPGMFSTFAKFSRYEQIAFLSLFAAALIIRLLVPHRLVMTYSGYGLIEQAIHFGELKKYGAGTPLFYHFLLKIFGTNQVTYLAINSILGWLTVAIASIWFGRYLKLKWVSVALLLLLSIHPLLIKDHNSESNLVPTMFIFFVGLNLWEGYRKKLEPKAFVFAAATFMLVFVCRPFFLFFIPFTLILLEAFREDGRLHALLTKGAIKKLFLISLVLLPHIVFLFIHFLAESKIGGAGGFEKLFDQIFIRFLSERNLFFRYDVTPVAFGLLWIVAIIKPSLVVSRKLFGLLVIGFLFFSFYFVDLPIPSLPRLQAPANYFFCMISAVGLIYLIKAVQDKLLWKVLFAAWLVVLGLSYYPATDMLWQPLNDDEEHKMLLQVAKHLPQDADSLSRLAEGDRPYTWGIFRNYPDSSFKEKNERLKVQTLTELFEVHAHYKNDSSNVKDNNYVYLGTRCYALILEHIPKDQLEVSIKPSQATIDYIHPLCKKIRAEYQLEAVIERSIPNHEIDAKFIWYPQKQELLIGLYKINGKKSEI